jgi:Protein of unknown function (DUF1573)
MRRLLVLMGLGVLLIGASPGAGLFAEAPVYDFGTVEQRAPIAHQFGLRNTSRAFIRIEQVNSSCGCTTAPAAGMLVAPGQLAWVPVYVDTSNLVGKTTKTVTIRTSDTRTPVVSLAVTGTVLSDLVVTPSPLYLGHVWQGTPVRTELSVRAGRPGPSNYTVSTVETESWRLHVYLQPGDKPGEQKIIVDLDPEVSSGRFNEQLTIRTTSPNQPVITVPVFGNVMGWG